MKKNYSPTQLLGHKAEKMACIFLQKRGLKKIGTNFHTSFGEIDLIMEDADTLIFIEVRYRQRNAQVSSEESVDRKKRKKIIKAALAYLMKYPTSKNCRFDMIAIHALPNGNEINWIKDAFQVQ